MSVPVMVAALLPSAAMNIGPEGPDSLDFFMPVEGKPLVLDASVMSDTQMELDVASSLKACKSWRTDIFGHISGNVRTFDWNHDSFMDVPQQLKFNVANRWQYAGENGVKVRFGFSALQDAGRGGQKSYDHDTFSIYAPDVPELTRGVRTW